MGGGGKGCGGGLNRTSRKIQMGIREEDGFVGQQDTSVPGEGDAVLSDGDEGGEGAPVEDGSAGGSDGESTEGGWLPSTCELISIVQRSNCVRKACVMNPLSAWTMRTV